MKLPPLVDHFEALDSDINDGFEPAGGQSTVAHRPKVDPKKCQFMKGKMKKIQCNGWRVSDSLYCVGHKRAVEGANDDPR